MQELFEILKRIETLASSDIPFALATVIETSGSTYRRPGARMLISEEDSIGAVSPGCLEDEVIAAAWNAIEAGTPQLISLDTTEEMDAIIGTGLGCRGIVTVYIEPLSRDGGALERYLALSQLLNEGKTAGLALAVSARGTAPSDSRSWLQDLDSDSANENRPWISDLNSLAPHKRFINKEYQLADEQIRIYAERIRPQERLTIFGAGFDAQPLAELAHAMGLQIQVVDHRSEYLATERFPDATELLHIHPDELCPESKSRLHDYIVIMTHNYLYDLKIMRYALSTDAQYVGQIGPKDRTDELLAELHKNEPITAEQRNRLHAPIGLDIGAETPEEIALSIMSEIIAVRNRRSGIPLKDRNLPIHDA